MILLFKKIRHVNDNIMNRMRKLTENEMKDILDEFDKHIPTYNTKEVNERFLEKVKTSMRKELENEDIIDHPDYVRKLKTILVSHWKKSIIPAGESVGVICAQSIGERQTQLTLNSFHQSGLSVATVVSGVPRFLELLNATKELKLSSNSFQLNRKINLPSDVRRFISNQLVCVFFHQIVKNCTIHLEKEDEYWYDAFELTYSNAFKDYHACISFSLDIKLLYDYQISMYHIKDVLEKMYLDIFVVFSPFHIGQLDVFVDLTDIEYNPGETPSFIHPNNFFMVYIEDVVKPKLLEIQVAGISNILKYYINKNNDGEWMIQTEGSNFREILSLPFVNPGSVMSTSMWDIYETMGIEAVREFLIEEFTKVVSSDGTFINECHILLLADIMTFHGIINSISRYGMKKEQTGVLSRSSFEESLDHFVTAAFYSEKEPVQAVSASIMCGKRSNVGSGFCNIVMDWDRIENEKMV